MLINKHFSEDQNFWQLNEQLKFLKPYSTLYKNDKTKDKKQSSKDMWMIFFMCDPDSETNKFYRIPYDERLQIFKETYNDKFDEKDKLIEECMQSYVMDILDPAERAFKDEIDSLVKRADFLSKAQYTFDDVERDAKGAIIFVSGKPMVKKGTAAEIDKMRSYTLKIYEQYEAVEQKFNKHKANVRIHGGRKESLSEKNLL